MTTRHTGMWKVFALLLLLAGCATESPRRLTPHASTQEDGATVAQHIQDRYDQLYTECRPSYTPAVLCTGVLMRGTIWSTGYHSWIPNPANANGGVSFSWLRQDSNFGLSAYPNGFIVYPHFYSDTPNFYQLTVNCGYVINAGTNGLPDKCRSPCHAQGVLTAAQWQAKYGAGSYGCAFKIAPGDAAPDAAVAWMQIVEVRKARSIFTWNEIMVEAWPQNTYANMPLEAFFYISGNASGLASAKLDQQDFRTTAGRWVPVIRWTPATSIGGRATFAYNAADQAILN
ncbi:MULTISPECIES: hypothetical protein [Rhodanobacteraceae]|uniref:hypothetical protein n=1 Tax=Rhodanobacteraceae TaxID=1775411 RepID=UPI0008901E50|nr:MULTISPECIES: hypothetical protein [Rhodanobacteraceae]MDR6643340.1 hypothetical protein [Luteibacter sp. 1214]SDF24952.1 hypothetical protein SAMN04515659_0493 [Dyella sp. 333MFSha]